MAHFDVSVNSIEVFEVEEIDTWIWFGQGFALLLILHPRSLALYLLHVPNLHQASHTIRSLLPNGQCLD